MRDIMLRLLTLCAISAATERMKLGHAIGHICSLCVIEAIVEVIALALSGEGLG